MMVDEIKQTRTIGDPDAMGWSIKYTADQTGESEWSVKNKLRRGLYEAVKSGRRTIILPNSVRRYFHTLPVAQYVPPVARAAKRAGT
jgi:hypothetical protein